MSDQAAVRPRRLYAGILAFLPFFGGDDGAEQAVREGNALFEMGQFTAALREYEAAAETRPDSPEIAFNRGNALFKTRDREAATDQYLAALAAGDRRLAGRAKYNVGVIKFRAGLAAAESYEDALTLTRTAIQYFREALELDDSLAAARHNLELAYRFRHRVEEEMLHEQRNAEPAPERTSLRRGQALQDIIRDEGSGQRQAMPDLNRRPHGQRGNETPETFANNEQQGQPPQSARLPMGMSPDAAHQMMEELRQRLDAAEAFRQQQRRNRIQQANERTPW